MLQTQLDDLKIDVGAPDEKKEKANRFRSIVIEIGSILCEVFLKNIVVYNLQKIII